MITEELIISHQENWVNIVSTVISNRIETKYSTSKY